jgi:hypothetical protein
VDPNTGKVYKCKSVQFGPNGPVIWVWDPILAASASGIAGSDPDLTVWASSSATSQDFGDVFAAGDNESHFSSTGDPFLELPGHMTNRLQVDFWNGTSWITCADSDWIYNPNPDTSSMYVDWHTGNACGNGWYGVYNGAFAINGSSGTDVWVGGWIWSGSNCFGCAAAATGSAATRASAAPAPPPAPPAPPAGASKSPGKRPAPSGAAARTLPQVTVR